MNILFTPQPYSSAPKGCENQGKGLLLHGEKGAEAVFLVLS